MDDRGVRLGLEVYPVDRGSSSYLYKLRSWSMNDLITEPESLEVQGVSEGGISSILSWIEPANIAISRQ